MSSSLFKLSLLVIAFLTPCIASAYTPYSRDTFYFTPSIAIKDAATSAAIESITGKNIYDAYANSIIKANKTGRVSLHLCNGKDEDLNIALIGGCSLFDDVSVFLLDTKHYIEEGGKLIEVDIHNSKEFISKTTVKYITEENPLIKQHNCKEKRKYGSRTTCFVYQMAPFVFENQKHKQKVLHALENPCQALTPLDDAHKYTGLKYPRLPYLGRDADDSLTFLDCNTKVPETYSTIVDDKTQSVLLIRNNK